MQSLIRSAGWIPVLGIVLLALLTLAYANHFDNGFQFDDSHTIENNLYIRDLGNVPSFFTDSTTFSSKPGNQNYRPLMTLLSAVDYRLAGDRLDPFWFHLDTYVWYVLQLVLMFFFVRHLFERAQPHRWNGWAALAATAFYGFHTANAETLNYISARSDSISTFFVVAAFATYLRYPGRRWYGLGLYLVPLLLGLLSKQSALVFPGLLFVYALLFEGGGEGADVSWRRAREVALKVVLLPLVLCIGFYVLQDRAHAGGGGGGTPISTLDYALTQPWVVFHYFQNFVLPVQLVVDSDMGPFTSLATPELWVGFLFVGLMLWFAWKCLHRREWRPIAFGILWFFIALAPTSSFKVFTQVMNDHRTFFPYIGLAIAAAWAVALWVYRREASGRLSPAGRGLVAGVAALVIGLHGYGVHARNAVWGDGVELWLDAVTKAPTNGRSWMNLGVELMARGRLKEAKEVFEKALELWPGYSYAHINMGIVLDAMGGGDPKAAEGHFTTAIRNYPQNPEAYFHYARFLARQGRNAEAITQLEKNLSISPSHIGARHLLLSLYEREGRAGALMRLARETAAMLPDDAQVRRALAAAGEMGVFGAEKRAQADPGEDNLLTLSLERYKAGQYRESIAAAERVLALDGAAPANRAAALNNICIANLRLGEFGRGIEACRRALKAQPSLERARNNLAWGERLAVQQARFESLAAGGKGDAKAFRELSLFFFNEGFYERANAAAEQALAADPRDAEAHNYLCASFNRLKDHRQAIVHCEKALEIRPDYELARNNLAYARAQLR